jgi:hypothetical protein
MVVTKADVYERVIKADRPICPHCGQRMRIWECVESGLSCGSGWGTPYLFVCVNDTCPLFVNGWKEMKRNYGRTCSCRCISFLGSRVTETMMVFSSVDCVGGLIDEAVVERDRLRGTDEDPLVQELIEEFEHNDYEALEASLFDEAVYWKVRVRAAELLGDLGRPQTVEPLQTARFGDTRIAEATKLAIRKIHAINQTRECPHCAETICAESHVCPECGRPLS